MVDIARLQKTHQIGHPSRLHPATKNARHPATPVAEHPATFGQRARFYIGLTNLHHLSHQTSLLTVITAPPKK